MTGSCIWENAAPEQVAFFVLTSAAPRVKERT